MRISLIAAPILVVIGVSAVNAQSSASNPPRLQPQADPATLTQQVQKLRVAAKVDSEVKAQVDKLVAEASSLQSAGRRGEAGRPLAHALTLLNGRTWDAREEFAWSLAFRTEKILADSSIPVMGALGQIYSAPYKPAANLRLKIALLAENGEVKPVREVALIDFAARDFVEKPLPLALNLHGIADGTYLLSAGVFDGDTQLCSLRKTVRLVKDLDTAGALAENRLAKIEGHDSAKATIRYPYDLARVVNLGKRALGSGDFGLDSPAYDFAKGIKHSADVLLALEEGRDLLWRAKGDNTRHYWFAEAGEIMPYRVFVPPTWDGKAKLPMLVVLHGNTRDYDYYFDRDGGILAKTAQQHGWLVVCPLGYHPNGGYGAGGGGKGKGKGGLALDPWVARRGEFSEKDAINVADLVAKEYVVDRSQVYLFGHSSGGTGTWHLGQKFAERWAGIAISAGRANAATYPFDRLKGKAVVLFHGDEDVEVPLSASRTMDKALTAKGIVHQYFEFKGATHATVVALAIPKVFEYFDKHRGVLKQ
jgi:poly(3-hydroxybutyrate) depolymerase